MKAVVEMIAAARDGQVRFIDKTTGDDIDVAFVERMTLEQQASVGVELTEKGARLTRHEIRY